MKSILVVLFFVVSTSLFGGWAEQSLEQMSLEEKVGQLFVIPICPPRGNVHFDHLKQFLEKYPVGGVILKQAHPSEQVPFLNNLQETSKYPLMTLADAEWGLGMRMKETLSYPRNLTLGAVQDLSLLREMGRQIAEQCRLVGAHMNLAPVADVNTNPMNPVIKTRAFGDDPYLVALQVSALFQGMQEKGLFACAKHFPGHGDREVDSHHDLPLVRHGVERLRAVEWVPFKTAVQNGVKGVMSAHLLIPACDTAVCTFSYHVITNILKKELQFDGLIVTDAVNMKALTNYFSPGEVGLKAFLAGHHFLLYGSHKDEVVDSILNELVPKAYDAILNACKRGEVSEKVLNQRILKILRAKEEMGLHVKRTISESPDLMQELNREEYGALKKRLFEEAVTLFRDEGLPRLNQKIAYVQVGKEELTPFFFDLNEELNVTPVLYEEGLSLDEFDAVIIGLYASECPKELQRLSCPYTAVFTSPYALESCPKTGTIIIGYESAFESEKVVCEILTGKRKAKGKLPISFPF